MTPICSVDDIPEREARGFETAQGSIFITQRDGQFYGYHNLCPHLDVNLEYMEDEFLDREHEYIICSNHSALFQVETGLCIWGPCQGQSLTTVPLLIQDGQIYVEGIM